MHLDRMDNSLLNYWNPQFMAVGCKFHVNGLEKSFRYKPQSYTCFRCMCLVYLLIIQISYGSIGRGLRPPPKLDAGEARRVSCTIRARHPDQYLDNMAAIVYPELLGFSTFVPLDVLAGLV